MEVEVARAHYRPERITTLFVGESAPYSGAFFYLRQQRHDAPHATRCGVGLGASGNFLDSFKAYGWYQMISY